MTGPQALRRYFGGNVKAMRRFLNRLQAKGLITLSTELVRDRQETESPIAVIQLGSVFPPAEQVAYKAAQLWLDSTTPKLIIRGTVSLATLYGSEIRTVASANLSHEVALVGIILNKLETNPDCEFRLLQSKPGGGAFPDAIFASAQIELVGRYSGAMVAAKMVLAARANLEFW